MKSEATLRLTNSIPMEKIDFNSTNGSSDFLLIDKKK